MFMNREIGGFFQLELNKSQEYHSNAIKLNSARYCLQYILKAKKYKKIYIPYYICDSVLQPIKEESLKYEFYSINDRFEPVFSKNINEDECFLYVNYFGLNTKNVTNVKVKYRNVIVDNTQAFFEKPEAGSDTIYSARKFFGVPDGGYLYTDKFIDYSLEQDKSYDRCEHLLKRLDTSANESYELFIKNEEDLSKCGMKTMSILTNNILSSINYKKCKKERRKNFLYLHNKLEKYNELKFDINKVSVPMIYPLLIPNNTLKEKMIKNKIYIPTYWNEVLSRTNKNSFEYKMAQHLIPIPIDQRYNQNHMNLIIEFINEHCN